MNVSEFSPQSHKVFQQINENLSKTCGLSIDWDSSVDHLQDVLEHYSSRKDLILEEGLTAENHQEYSKAWLITEAIRLFLKEIAPSRKKSRRNK